MNHIIQVETGTLHCSADAQPQGLVVPSRAERPVLDLVATIVAFVGVALDMLRGYIPESVKKLDASMAALAHNTGALRSCFRFRASR
jgi:hypothetical protein